MPLRRHFIFAHEKLGQVSPTCSGSGGRRRDAVAVQARGAPGPVLTQLPPFPCTTADCFCRAAFCRAESGTNLDVNKNIQGMAQAKRKKQPGNCSTSPAAKALGTITVWRNEEQL